MTNRRRPKISIAKIVQWGNDLAMICKQDKSELLKAGLQWETVLKLEELIYECSDADTLYQLRKESLRLAGKHHKEFIIECQKLRSTLRENINRAFEFIQTSRKLPGLSQKTLKSELVQDLQDLAVICRTNRFDFEKVHFDFSLAQRADRASEELSIAVADLDLQRRSIKHEELDRRNSHYSELYNNIKEICSFGRYVFKNDPTRRKIYCSIK